MQICAAIKSLNLSTCPWLKWGYVCTYFEVNWNCNELHLRRTTFQVQCRHKGQTTCVAQDPLPPSSRLSVACLVLLLLPGQSVSALCCHQAVAHAASAARSMNLPALHFSIINIKFFLQQPIESKPAAAEIIKAGKQATKKKKSIIIISGSWGP